MGRGVAGLPLFCGPADRDIFLETVGETVERQGWICLGYVVLTTHYHLLLRTPEPDLAHGMQRLNGHYAQGFNRRHGGRGHVFESRYLSLLVQSDAHLLWLFRYLAWNPVEAGLCEDPKDWDWSSYRCLLGLQRPPRFLAVDAALAYFGHDRARARTRLRAFVEQEPPAERPAASATNRPPRPAEPARAA